MSAYFYAGRCFKISKNNRQINDEIRAPKLRVISDKGEQLGIMTREEAMRISEQKNLDLVCVSPNADPPVCKILDYGK